MLSDPENLSKVEQMAAINYSPRQIATYFNIHAKSFLTEWSKRDSELRKAFERGILIARMETDMALLDAAKKGNITAQQQWEKNMRINKLEAIRETMLNGEI
jgi:hypothetical protein